MPEQIPAFFDPEEPLPFEHLFAPLVVQARSEIDQRIDPKIRNLFSPPARAGLERHLLSRLSAAGAQAADWQFHVSKTVQMAFPSERSDAQGGGTVRYRKFIGVNPADSLRHLFEEFSTLENLCAVLARNWVEASEEFLRRFEADRSKFNEHFSAARFPCPVTNIEAGLGDPHRSGRSVIRLTFENGIRLIYKPRPLAPEAHFSELLRELNTAGTPHVFRSANLWDRGDYGWMEDVEHRPCKNTGEVHAFYWRAGALLGLLFLARGVDCHQGNLIAEGEFPVFIDLEALWHPQTPNGNGSMGSADSVLRTGFLPSGYLEPGNPYQWSGLGRNHDAKWPRKIWVRVNQDNMALETHCRGWRNPFHLPVLAGATHPASNYASDIVKGFRWIGENLLGSQRWQGKFDRWLRVLAGRPRRLILRPTVLYHSVLAELTRPQVLREHRAFSACLDAFTQKRQPAFEGEAGALSQMDVPYFEQADLEKKAAADARFRLPSQESYLAQVPVIAQALAGKT